MERVLERRPAVDWTSGVTPQLEKPNLDTVPREPTIERVDYAVDEATDDLIAATARPRWRSMLLYGLAAMAAVIIGVIPALWINRRRADETALALPEPARASSVSSPAALANPPSIAGPAEPSLAAELPATASAEPPPAREPAPAAAARPETAAGKGGKPSRPHSVKPAAKPAAPANKHKQAETAPCDVYLHPHGCPH